MKFDNMFTNLIYNDLNKAEEYFEKYPNSVAAVITEPVEIEEPQNNFLYKLKELCNINGALLIFDEVVDGFRFEEHRHISWCYTRFIYLLVKQQPMACHYLLLLANEKSWMRLTKKYFAYPLLLAAIVFLAAGIAVMKELASGEVNKALWEKGRYLQDNFRQLAKDVPIDLQGYPVRMSLFYTDYNGKKDWLYNSIFMQECVKRGVLLGWHIFPCYSHTKEDLDYTLNVFEDAMKVYKKALKSGNPASYMERYAVKNSIGINA